MIKLLFLGTYIPQEKINKFSKVSSYIDFAGILLQDSLHTGFCDSTECKAVTIPVLKTGKQDKKIKSYYYHWGNTDDNYSVGYTNIVGIKELTAPIKALKYIKRNKIEPDVLFIYSLGVIPYSIAYFLKKRFPSMKVLSMVADLPEYMSNHSNFIYRFLKGIDKKLTYALSRSIDGYIFLSPYMREKIPVGNRPTIVVEGIYNSNNAGVVAEKTNNDTQKIIFYSGTLAERYGIFGLIEAFKGIHDNDCSLFICGNGEDVDRIKEETEKDRRIQYLGVLPHDEVIQIQQQATLLINPLLSSVPSTRYSFSSKTFEYMASGTPTLMAKLPSIPEEYYPHLYFFEKETVDGLRDKIVELLSKPSEELEMFGGKAREFVIQNKSIKAQTTKIMNFIERLNVD